MQELRKKMYREILASNKFLNEDYLDTLSMKAVIVHTHPLYRSKWQFQFDSLED